MSLRRARGSSRPPRGGFTLIEMALAITMMGLALASFYKGFRLADKTVGRVRAETRAIELAQSILSEAQAEGYEAIRNRSGPIEGDYVSFGYELAVTRHPKLPLAHLRVIMRWTEPDGPHSMAFHSTVASRKVGAKVLP